MTRRAISADHHVAKRLRELRHELGLSQEQIAAQLGVTFQQVQKYENGSNRISAGKLYHVAKVFGRPISAFYEGMPDDGVTVLAPDRGRNRATLELVKAAAALSAKQLAALRNFLRALTDEASEKDAA